MSVEELLKKAEKPSKLAVKYHQFYKGKIEVIPKCAIRNMADFAIWYTPGVAKPCTEIHKDPEKVYEYTNKWNSVAVVTDGSRILGLGDIGPMAGLPVMEGKALLFKYLGGVDAYPICLNTKDPDEIIQAVKWIQPGFGGINLEDIEKPKCFYILDTLRKELEIPVWHDDQQGTAAITLAGMVNALKLVGKKMSEVKVAMIGAGAANVAIYRLITAAGVDKRKILMVDRHGILRPNRSDMEELKKKNPIKWKIAIETNPEDKEGGIPESMEGADICIAASKPGPGTIKKEWITKMADDAVVFAMANPVPEIWPWEAKEAGAKIVATGRSDFPNQINNSLGFPGIFRGTLDVRAKTITDEKCMAAAESLADSARMKGLNEDYIVPTMEEWEVYPREAVAVGMKAIEQGVARIKMSRDELYHRAETIIKHARETVKLLMKNDFIKKPPE